VSTKSGQVQLSECTHTSDQALSGSVLDGCGGAIASRLDPLGTSHGATFGLPGKVDTVSFGINALLSYSIHCSETLFFLRLLKKGSQGAVPLVSPVDSFE
jgi:hypothetical protein